MQWKRSDEYRNQAQRCSQIARMMSTRDSKRVFEKLANAWTAMATRAEASEQQAISTGPTGRFDRHAPQRINPNH